MRRLFIIAFILSTISILMFGARPAMALFEGAKDQACQGIALSQNPADNDCTATSASGLNNVLKVAINGFSLAVGIIAVIMVIVGGLKYVTSSGDSANVNSAKNTILYAIIGLAVVALAQFILHFVIGRVAK